MQIGPVEPYDRSSLSLTALSQTAAARIPPADPPQLQPVPRKISDDAVVVRLSAREPLTSGLTNGETSSGEQHASTGGGVLELSEDEKSVVERLRQRDAEVRAHEQAHEARLGAYAKGGPQYQFQTGPDKKQYAVGGEVGVDVSPEDDPQKTIEKMQTIKAAANAPAEPSGPDKQVAAQAQALEQKALQELQQSEPRKGAQGTAASAGSSQSAATSNPFAVISAGSDDRGLSVQQGDGVTGIGEPQSARRPTIDIYA